VETSRRRPTYVDAKLAGLSWKQAVRAATTAAGTLATSFENGDAIDGVTLATGDRILIKNQATASENGIYVVNASGAPTRATDADAGAELVNATVYVSEGTPTPTRSGRAPRTRRSRSARPRWRSRSSVRAASSRPPTRCSRGRRRAGGAAHLPHHLTSRRSTRPRSRAACSRSRDWPQARRTARSSSATTGYSRRRQAAAAAGYSSIWDPFIPDASPHALNDEFESSATISNWTGVYTGDVGVISDIATSSVKGMYFEAPTVQYRLRAYMKSLGGYTGDFTVHTCVVLNAHNPAASTITAAGILLADGVTAGAGNQSGHAVARANSSSAGILTAGRFGWSNYGNNATGAVYDNADYGHSISFLRFRRVSGVYYRAISPNGENDWAEISIGLSPAIATPTHVGLFFQNYGGISNNSATLKYFRFYTTGTQYKTGASRRQYG
jgi:hypothetical protein